MILGTANKDGKVVCATCGKFVKSDMENYCFHCGNPIKEDAIMLTLQQQKNTKLELLNDLIEAIDDEKALIAIKQKLDQVYKEY